jgi:hypothetical protein
VAIATVTPRSRNASGPTSSGRPTAPDGARERAEEAALAAGAAHQVQIGAPLDRRLVERDGLAVAALRLACGPLVFERDCRVGRAPVQIERAGEAMGRLLPADLDGGWPWRVIRGLVEQLPQRRGAVLHEIVVHPDLRPVRRRGQRDEAGAAALAPHVLGEAFQGQPDGPLGRDVAVEEDRHVALIEGDVVPLGEEGHPAEGVLALEAPDAVQRDDAVAVLREGVDLLDPLGDEEGCRRVAERRAAPRGDIELDPGAERHQVLRGTPGRRLRRVGAVQVTPRLAVGAVGGDEQARPGPLALLEAEAHEVVLAEGGAIAPLPDHLVRQPAAVPQVGVVGREEIRDRGRIRMCRLSGLVAPWGVCRVSLHRRPPPVCGAAAVPTTREAPRPGLAPARDQRPSATGARGSPRSRRRAA